MAILRRYILVGAFIGMLALGRPEPVNEVVNNVRMHNNPNKQKSSLSQKPEPRLAMTFAGVYFLNKFFNKAFYRYWENGKNQGTEDKKINLKS